MNARWLVGLLGLALMAAPGCATKKFVNTRVTDLNDKVEALTQSIERTQSRTHMNERGIVAAQQKATDAQTSADAARHVADGAVAKVDDVERASRRVVYELVLSEDGPGFAFGTADLPDAVKARLDAMMQNIKANPNGAYFEIEGHTDAIGSKEYNQRLGLERAEAVKDYLYRQHYIPLYRISVVSYGEERPVAGNHTATDRAQNRRIVVRVVK